MTVQKVAVVGTGVIGNGWIARALAQGYDVVATDPADGAEERMRRAVDQAWPYVEALGLAEGASKDRLTFEKDMAEAVMDADFIQENVPEVEELKQTVLKNIDQHAKAEALIGSSTSGIMPSELQADLQHPERFVVAHPFHPVYILPLVEVVPGKQTTTANVDKAKDFYESMNMSVLLVRHEIEGHIADRLIEAIWRESLHIVNDGIATTEEVDKAFTHGAGLRYAQYGPFLTFHLAGGEGGMRHMLKQFGPALKKPWTKLEAPDLTDELYDKVVSGCEEQANGMTMSELDQNRNEFLIRLYDLVQEYWPQEREQTKA
ncbi:3-hydroxyacyl-CoA dehydrogenase NAD-binding domain-containing protein [Halobacillus karajensis]|uniref:L-carnitine dehydrogenase n=1 Tax=Halobacillus karajensis TaxID=195088 RepID=A0A024P8I1_9BACI|nr:3-hydroxyacyl-CoA dehydrogenase NAD-binding domain-containing protein [Halobacillus karajensis]CDQ20112.1 L-carnitine dehydrogenase [Halobacillus karajensis]CDQ25225.1 L-carnitine dehydrogenase [Halobacillus karajensis]CDQ28414.1 L-carnitine dehydrogenase [Halobacillus karajensis]